MSRRSLGSESLKTRTRLKVAGWLWMTAGRLYAKTEDNYQRAYYARHGRPTLKQLLDGEQ